MSSNNTNIFFMKNAYRTVYRITTFYWVNQKLAQFFLHINHELFRLYLVRSSVLRRRCCSGYFLYGKRITRVLIILYHYKPDPNLNLKRKYRTSFSYQLLFIFLWLISNWSGYNPLEKNRIRTILNLKSFRTCTPGGSSPSAATARCLCTVEACRRSWQIQDSDRYSCT